jgi:hypothetical protein
MNIAVDGRKFRVAAAGRMFEKELARGAGESTTRRSTIRRATDFRRSVCGMLRPELAVGKARLGHRPSKKSIKRMVERVHALTDRARSWQETTELVDMLNRAAGSSSIR